MIKFRNEKIKVNIILIQIIDGNNNLFVYNYLKQSKAFMFKYTLNERYKYILVFTS